LQQFLRHSTYHLYSLAPEKSLRLVYRNFSLYFFNLGGSCEEFIRLEWEAGLDARKEFHQDILIPNLSYDLIVDELFFMKKTYDKIRKELAENNKEIILFAVPLMWSHAEYASALIDRYEALGT